MTVDERFAIGTERAAQTEQTMMTPRGADAFRSADPHEAIAWNAAIADICFL